MIAPITYLIFTAVDICIYLLSLHEFEKGQKLYEVEFCHTAFPSLSLSLLLRTAFLDGNLCSYVLSSVSIDMVALKGGGG
jgi:hypothetical protein